MIDGTRGAGCASLGAPMKTVVAILAAIVLPGGFVVLAAGALTYLIARERMRVKASQETAPLT